MNQLLISLGSNMPCGEENMEAAIEEIRAKATFAQFSSMYDTDPVGLHRHARYKNCVGQLHSPKSFEEWKALFKNLEQAAGRNDELRAQGNVPLDIDIVIWNEEVMRPRDLSAEYLQQGLQEIAHNH